MSNSMKARPALLDCTLRDGGYVNNWEFGAACARAVADGLYQAGIRCIELGIMGQGGAPGQSTKFSDFSELEPLLADRRADCQYAAMVNQADASRYSIPPRGSGTPDILRLAFFKPEWQQALETCRAMMDKGYQVFLQTMATFLYSPKELEALLREVSRVRPAAFYIVDSFGTMEPEDVCQTARQVLDSLPTEIPLGFHAHNNLQMAYSNTISFLSLDTGRPLFADGSLYGMGRGAGNAPIELLMHWMNQRGGRFDTMAALEIIEAHIQPIYRQYGWGYSPKYFLTAQKKCNSAYGWYLGTRGVEQIGQVAEILDGIPEEKRYALNRQEADKGIARVFGRDLP